MEPVSSFLDAFIKLADRIINLEKAKLESKQKLFNEIVKPIFDELEPVASNYIGFFRKARQTIKKSKLEDLREVADQIREERDALSMAQIKVREMANQLKDDIDDEEIVSFAMSVNNFFYSAPRFPQVQGGAGSSARMFLNFLKYASLNNVGKQEVIDHVDLIIESIEQAWSAVVKSYERVKIHSVAPRKTTRKRKSKKAKSK